MDFGKVSFDTVWEEDTAVRQAQASKATKYGCVFAFTSTCLIIAIIRTISTNPGNIPDHKEWDMGTDSSAAEEERSTAHSGLARSSADEQGTPGE